MINFLLIFLSFYQLTMLTDADPVESLTLNKKASGYRGIWYMNQPSNDEYVYKYSGGLGTYCAKHQPFAIYNTKANKTYFCYGGTTKESNRQLLHMVSYFDHETKMVPKPTILLNKNTDDAHDNPVISIDAEGYIWIFSTSHGTSRPSYIHRSRYPYEINEFILVDATRVSNGQQIRIDNFSYMQAWHLENQGFFNFFTRYNYPTKRTICAMTSIDGINWSEWQRLATIGEGHYQISAIGNKKAGSAFNFHPSGKGLNWRTNLYYLESRDNGNSWQSANGSDLNLPLTDKINNALVREYESEGLNVYLKDICYDDADRPIILYLTSKGYQSGPKNNPRTWMVARWTGKKWTFSSVTVSDNNYDMGSLWIREDNSWHIVAPTATGPQPYNPGGEIVHLQSKDLGNSWIKVKQLTQASIKNHTYVRRPLNTHPDFFAFWADGHGRQPSASDLYFSDINGNVYRLPREMKNNFEMPVQVD